MTISKKIILASSSPARRLLMQRLMLSFTCLSPNIDETPLAQEMPEQMVERLAREKARVFANTHSDSIIIGVDQIGVFDGDMLGKPITHDQAVSQLMKMSGKIVRFYIGVCLLDTSTGLEETSLETYDVTFRSLTKNMIENYLKKEPALQCAGSLQVEGLGIVLLEKLSGDDYTALIGLPLIRVSEMLRKFGVDLP
jgi:septum formation protein